MTIDPSADRPYARAVSRILALCLVVLGITFSPVTTERAQADPDCEPLQCLTIYSKLEAPNWRALDIARGWGGDGASNYGHLNVWPANKQSNQKFAFKDDGDGSFQMVVHDGRKCVSAEHPGWLGERACQNTADQKWYLQPTPSGGFMIRSVANDKCLNARGGHSGQNFVFRSNQTQLHDCEMGDQASFWSIHDHSGAGEAQANTLTMKALAAKYAMTKCDKDKTYCKWKVDKTGEPEYGTPVCRGFSRNGSARDVPTKLTATETSLHSETVGGNVQDTNEIGVTVKLNFGDLGVDLAQKFIHSWGSNWSRSDTKSTTWTQDFTLTLQPGEWGWIEETPFVQDLTGHFTFDRNNWAEWSFGDTGSPMTVSVARGSGTDAKSAGMYEVRSSKEQPDCGGGSRSAVSATSTLVGARSGRCLDAPDYRTAPGTRPVVWDCTKGDNQKWTRTTDGSLTVLGKCLAAEGGGKSASTRAVLAECDGSDSQKWAFESGNTVRQSGLCLDAVNGATANGTELQLWPCSQSDNQKWKRV
ncbi:ricin-type beta-trefoil lectin domain protein [Streptomyces sp. NPDC051907]|uniref:ricin-type beta-trefoil lectin domain protein n=1 Tax=Streptomyces sp. NPDC051907 TaxID=3155284 RepID=UPI003428B3E0